MSRFSHDAEDRIVDTVKWVEGYEYQYPSYSQHRISDDLPNGQILVKNETGSVLERLHVGMLSDPTIDAFDDLSGFLNHPVFEIIDPNDTSVGGTWVDFDHANNVRPQPKAQPIVVVLEKLKQGDVGVGIVQGPVFCKVKFVRDDTFGQVETWNRLQCHGQKVPWMYGGSPSGPDKDIATWQNINGLFIGFDNNETENLRINRIGASLIWVDPDALLLDDGEEEVFWAYVNLRGYPNFRHLGGALGW